MNTSLLTSIRNMIAMNPNQFTMEHMTCGTAHCIAGWALTLAGEIDEHARNYRPIGALEGTNIPTAEPRARDLLGLTEEEAQLLFYGPWDVALTDITDEDAIDTLDHLIATGEIRWRIS